MLFCNAIIWINCGANDNSNIAKYSPNKNSDLDLPLKWNSVISKKINHYQIFKL